MAVQADSYDFASDLLLSAQVYTGYDLPVFPLHSPLKDPRARCDCSQRDACKRPAKHPRTEHGLSDASLDEEQVNRWWRMWPRANVGIAVPLGYVVLDIDGLEGLEAIRTEGWIIPTTVTAATARGWHYWFTADVEVRPGSRFLDHVDLRGPGGYVVAPPSLHCSGVQYEWERSIVEYPIAPAPAWLFEMIKRARERRRTEPQDAPDGPIFEGGRNDTLTRFAGYLRRRPEVTERVILAALEALNAERCSPPLDHEELEIIAHSVARYAPETTPEYQPTQIWTV